MLSMWKGHVEIMYLRALEFSSQENEQPPKLGSCSRIYYRLKNIAKPSSAGRNESLRWNGHLCKEKTETYYLYFIWRCKACQVPAFSISAIRLQIPKWVQKRVRQVSKKPWNRVISRLFTGGGRWIRTPDLLITKSRKVLKLSFSGRF